MFRKCEKIHRWENLISKEGYEIKRNKIFIRKTLFILTFKRYEISTLQNLQYKFFQYKIFQFTVHIHVE